MLGAAVVLITVLAPSTISAGQLFPHPTWPMSRDPLGILAVDLDADGFVDIISANFRGFDIVVMRGNGDGTFAPAERHQPCPPEGGPTFPAVGDFNEDAILDVAVNCGFQDELSILLGNPDGTLGPGTRYASAQYIPWMLKIGDFNGDHHQDLVSAVWNGGWTVLRLGNGDGTFGPEQALDDDSPSDFYVTVGDFNGDGYDDLAEPYANIVRVRLNQGDGTFAVAVRYPVGYDAQHVEAADLNGDQVVDLVVANQGSNDVSVLLGNGDGTFAGEQRYATDDSSYFVAVADIHGDGLVDLVVSNALGEPAGGLSLLRGTGGGAFAAAVALDPARINAYSIAIADFDRDGALDIARPDFGGDELHILFGRGGGEFAVALQQEVGESPQDVTVADFNADGRPDLAVANGDSNDVSILLAVAAGTFAPEVRYAVGSGPTAVVAGEFVAPAALDLAVLNALSNDMTILVGDGSGSFTPMPGPSVGSAPASVAVGDFDENGQNDLAVANGGSDDLFVLLGQEGGGFAPPRSLPAGTSPDSLVVADLDGDGHQDLIVANRDSDDVAVFLGEGDGTFVGAPSVAVGSAPSAVAVGDLDEDDQVDLVVIHGGAEDLRIFPGNGDGTFAAAVHVTPTPFPGWSADTPSLRVADLDADGHLDVAIGAGGHIAVLRGNGTTSPGPEEDYVTPGLALSLVDADFDNDSLPDLAAINDSGFGFGPYLSILLNQSGPSALSFAADASTLSWPAVVGALSYNVYRGDLSALVDLDEDGLPDDGYGACMPELDGDPTDTFMVDPETPGAGAGFFYLRSVMDPQGERDLGASSAGLERQPGQPCP